VPDRPICVRPPRSDAHKTGVLCTAVEGGSPDGDLDLTGLLVLQLSRLGGGNLPLAALLVPLQREPAQRRQ